MTLILTVKLANGQVGSCLLDLSIKSHKQPVSVVPGVKTNIGGLIAATTKHHKVLKMSFKQREFKGGRNIFWY